MLLRIGWAWSQMVWPPKCSYQVEVDSKKEMKEMKEKQHYKSDNIDWSLASSIFLVIVSHKRATKKCL